MRAAGDAGLMLAWLVGLLPAAYVAFARGVIAGLLLNLVVTVRRSPPPFVQD